MSSNISDGAAPPSVSGGAKETSEMKSVSRSKKMPLRINASGMIAAVQPQWARHFSSACL